MTMRLYFLASSELKSHTVIQNPGWMVQSHLGKLLILSMFNKIMVSLCSITQMQTHNSLIQISKSSQSNIFYYNTQDFASLRE